jgi:acyl-CoA reductase-like NAD-dependent aldehyde dehydrogenase
MINLVSRNPATGEELGRAPVCTPEQVQAAVMTARTAQVEWGNHTVRQRLQELKKLTRILVEQSDTIARLVVAEQGKNQVEAYGEIVTALELLHYYQGHAAGILRTRTVSPRLGVLRSSRIVAQPRGVVGVISPWNYPITLSMEPAIAALVAGNAVILKPSEYTPLIGLKVGELMQQAGLPEGLFQVMTGDASTGKALVTARIDKLVFTGSAANGRKVAALAGEYLVPITLELGGKDAAIVMEDADLDKTVDGILWGALLNAGQACLAIERVYVVEKVADEFIKKLTAKARNLRTGPAENPENEICAITTEAQMNVLMQQVAEARQIGAIILLGGEPLPGPGRFFPPTVIVNATEEMSVMRDETFGPVIAIQKIKDAEEAIRLTNASPYGLTASLWTRDLRSGRHLLTRLEVGDAALNDHGTSTGYAEVGWGGRKASGYGKTRGAEGLREMVVWQHISWPRVGGQMMGFPYSVKKVNFVRKLIRILFGNWKERFSVIAGDPQSRERSNPK